MTTVLSKNAEFVSIDSRWTDTFNKVITTEMRKYLYADGELYLFSGDHLPILLEQAFYAKVITEDDYFRFYENLNNNEVFAYIAIKENNGYQVYDDNCSFDWFNGLSHTGSGGKLAAEFYHFAHKRTYKSKYGCNIIGALKHAFYWDECSGDFIYKRKWGQDHFDNTLVTDLKYTDYLSDEVNKYFIQGMQIMPTTLRSAMRTSPVASGNRVSLSTAKSRIEKRKLRLKEQQINIKTR